MICDACHEEFDPSFFCGTCSDRGKPVNEVPEVRAGPDGETHVIEKYVYLNICFHCCPGHRGEEAPPATR